MSRLLFAFLLAPTLATEPSHASDFHATQSLNGSGRITGTVHFDDTLAPVPSGRVIFLRRQDGRWGYSGEASIANGVYSSPSLMPDSYYVAVGDMPDQIGQLYPGVDCQIPHSPSADCSVAAAVAVMVADSTVVSGVNFSVRRGASIEGRVFDEALAQPLANASVFVALPSLLPSPAQVAHRFTDDQGRFSIAGLGPGEFKILAQKSGFLGRIYPNLSCHRCLVEAGEPLVLARNEQRTGLEVHLQRPGSIDIPITGPDNNLVAFPMVTALDKSTGLASMKFGTNGQARISNLAPGDYFVGGTSLDHRPAVLGIGAVESLDNESLLRGSQVRVEAGQTTILPPLQVQPAGRITGRISSGSSCIDVFLYSDDRPPLKRGCNPQGEFDFRGLADGAYTLVVRTDVGEAPVVWPNRTCSSQFIEGCYVPESAKLRVTSGSQLTDIVVVEPPRGELRVSTPISGTRYELFDADQQPLGGAADTLPAGDYYVRLSGPGFRPMLYPDAICQPTGCPFGSASKVRVEANRLTEIVFDPLIIASEPCRRDSTTHCFEGSRFEVKATWRTPQGETGAAILVGLTDQSGLFYFFSPFNTEILVKVLNACVDPYQRYWVLVAGLTDVAVELQVRDTYTNEIKRYNNSLGQPFETLLDTAGFDSCNVAPASTRAPQTVASDPSFALPEWVSTLEVETSALEEDTYLCGRSSSAYCTFGGRFKVRARYRTPNGTEGLARITRDFFGSSAAFAFFNRDNTELVVKVLDGCAINGHHWFFAAGATDVAVEIEVFDLASGKTRRYTNEQGRPFAPILDVEALDSCDVPDPIQGFF